MKIRENPRVPANDPNRCGRFAPSPTGPLHFGSLVTAVASFCEARTRGYRWLLRIEDVDAPRTVPGAADRQIAVLASLGFEWDGPIIYQSRRTDAYAAALERLMASGSVFACACTRKEIADSQTRSMTPSDEPVYPGTCRNGIPPGRSPRAIRVRAGSGTIEFDDALQGHIRLDLAKDIGDFVVRRADGLFAYQLAVAVDDADAGITDIVRGADLLGSTPRQIHLQHLLGYATPRYTHVPVAVNRAGEKLSKQTLAPAIDPEDRPRALLGAFSFLGQDAPDELRRASAREIWQWAFAHWSLDRVPRLRSIHAGHARDGIKPPCGEEESPWREPR